MKKIKDENILLIVLAIMSFSFGMWTNYRQLWLQSVGFTSNNISKILSISLICSSIIIFIISFFSKKIKLRNIFTFSIITRTIALLLLILFKNNYLIKVGMLLCIIAENLFSLTFYPLLSLSNSSNKIYKKHVSINYFFKDGAIVMCALLIGVSIGNKIFDYDAILRIVFALTFICSSIMLIHEEDKSTKNDNSLGFIKSIKNIFSKSNINYYLIGQFINEIAYSIVFGMLMLMLTNYLNIDVSYASVFIIICSISGTFVSKILSKNSEKISLINSNIIKYGIRILVYVLAFIFNNFYIYVISIFISYITTKLLDDRVNGTFIRSIEENNRFLFGNIRYFILCIADGIGIFISGLLLDKSLVYIFISASCLTLIATLINILFTHEEK